MKKQLLTIVALLAVSSIGHAMQPQKSFSYNTYKFNIPANMLSGMKPGEKFVVTQVDPNQMSALYINDAQGRPFAKNTYSVYPGGRTPGLGTLTYTVLTEAERQNLPRTPALPVAAVAKAAAAQTPAPAPAAKPVAKAPAAPASIVLPSTVTPTTRIEKLQFPIEKSVRETETAVKPTTWEKMTSMFSSAPTTSRATPAQTPAPAAKPAAQPATPAVTATTTTPVAPPVPTRWSRLNPFTISSTPAASVTTPAQVPAPAAKPAAPAPLTSTETEVIETTLSMPIKPAAKPAAPAPAVMPAGDDLDTFMKTTTSKPAAAPAPLTPPAVKPAAPAPASKPAAPAVAKETNLLAEAAKGLQFEDVQALLAAGASKEQIDDALQKLIAAKRTLKTQQLKLQADQIIDLLNKAKMSKPAAVSAPTEHPLVAAAMEPDISAVKNLLAQNPKPSKAVMEEARKRATELADRTFTIEEYERAGNYNEIVSLLNRALGQ